MIILSNVSVRSEIAIARDGRLTILHVDDEETNRYTIARMLAHEGFEVKQAVNGREALRLAKDRPDLIILDVHLPDINGFEVCKILKTDPATATIPVLHISALYITPADKKEGLESGADGYIISPVDQRELITTIKALVRMRQTEKKLELMAEALQQTNEELERRVEERTAKLQIANSLLQDEIVRRKEAEAANALLLIREQEAENANRIKDEFIDMLSHELRTPLTPLIGWTRMLRSGKLDNRTGMRAMEIIERNAEAQAHLIEKIIEISQIITGKLDLNFDLVALQPIMEHAIQALRPAADKKNIVLQTTLAASLCMVYGDARRLQQVFEHLLDNAVKFTGNNGRVDIEMKQGVDRAIVDIKDTGKGIRAEFLPYVFDRFRQENNTVTREFGGLGLGLTIARHLIERHKGTINLSSGGEGNGTNVEVQLPLAQ